MKLEQLFDLEANLRGAAIVYARADHTGGGGLPHTPQTERNAARKALRIAAVAYGKAVDAIDESIDSIEAPK